MMKKIKYISFAAALLTALQSLCVSPAGAQSAGNTEYNGEKAVLTVYTDVKQYIETLEPALEDDIATVYFDKNTANIAYLKKSTGEIWTSAPVSPCIADITPDEQKRVFSPVILTYTDSSLTEKELLSFRDCAEYGQIVSSCGKNRITSVMTVGNAWSTNVPDALTEERMNAFEKKLSAADYKYLKQSYNKYTKEKIKSDPDILKKYPALESQNVYVLRENTSKAVTERLNGILISAGFTAADRTAYIKEATGSEPTDSSSAVFKLELTYTLENGELSVSVPIGKIEYDKEKYTLLSISVLKYFGASDSESSGFFLLPDGSGALMEFNKGETGSGVPAEIPLYGYDTVLRYDPAKHNVKTASAPIFGVCRGGSGFAAIADEGDAQLSVRAVCDEGTSRLRYAHFKCGAVAYDEYTHSENATLDRYLRYAEGAYSGNYTVRYIFLDDAAYCNMAGVYREKLYKDGTLKRKNTAETEILLSFLGAADAEYNGLFTDKKLYALTTYSDVADIVEFLSENGVSGVSAELIGWANGGLNYTVFDKAKPLGILGGRKGFSKLVNAAGKNGTELFAAVDVSVIRNNSLFDGFILRRDASRQLDHTYSRTYRYNEGSGMGYYDRPYFCVSDISTRKFADRLLKSYNYGTGLSAAYLAKTLSSGNSARSGSRTESMERVCGILKDFSGRGKLMVEGGNAYAWKYASFIKELPSESSNYGNCTRSVPFLQMLLHGAVKYSGSPLNLSGDMKTAALRAIENGEVLSFTLAEKNTEYLSVSDYSDYCNVNYAALKETVIQYYNLYSETLGRVSDEIITGHMLLSDKVTATVYESGAEIIVNYGDKPFEYKGCTVEAGSARLITS